MENSGLNLQLSVGKDKPTVKRKSKFLSYSKKEKHAHILKYTTLDNFLVTSPVKSEECSSTSCSSHFITEVKEDKIYIEKEIKSKYFTTDSVSDGCTKSVVSDNLFGTVTTESSTGVNKTKNVSEEVNIFEDKSSLNDSTEFFLEKLESTNKDCKKLSDNKQTGEVIVPFNGETDNEKNMFKAQSDCTDTSTSTVVLQTKRIQCPLCLKKIEKYVTHIKMCAARRKLTPQQLMLALELQKRQAEERLALGLPLLPEKLPVTRKTGNNRGCSDANLDLALALSVSMKEAEEKEILEEADVLSQAGLKTEAAQKRSTLERFGFASTRPPTGIIGGHRTRPLVVSALMTRTREDRERIISEKVSLVLIGDDGGSVNVAEEFCNSEPIVFSKKLCKQLNRELRLWKKASVDEERSSYYVEDLGKFVTPTKADIGCNLRHLSQIAGRVNTPKKDDNTVDPITSSSHTQNQHSPIRTKSLAKTVTALSMLDVTAVKPPSDFPCKVNQLSASWRLMLGNCDMSDLLMSVVREKVYIPVHKLVIYVRCKQMFSDIVKTESGQDLIVLNCCSKTACTAFLEYLYCSTVNNISELSNSELSELNVLAKKYRVSELLKFLEDNKKIMNNRTVGSCDNNTVVKSAKRRLFREKKCMSESDDNAFIGSPTGVVAGNIGQRQDSVLSSDDDIKSIHSITESCSLSHSIYDQTTVMVVDSSPERSNSAENIVHKNLDMLLSLLQKDNVESPSDRYVKSLPKGTSPCKLLSPTGGQGRLEPSAKYVKRKRYCHNNVGNNDSDCVVDNDYDSDNNDESSNKKPVSENMEDDLTLNLNDENNDCNLTQNSDNKNEECDLTQKLLSNDENNYYDLTQNSNDKIDRYTNITHKLYEENDDYDLTQNPDDKNKEHDLTQNSNVGNNFFDLTQNSDDRIDRYNSTLKLSEDIDEPSDKINDSGDDVMILSGSSETCERSKEDYVGKDQISRQREYLSSSKVEETNCVTIKSFKDSSFNNKLEPISKVANPKSASVSYELDENDFIDPVWDGFEDLNCNINDVWQSDSPATHQKSVDTATEKGSSVKSISEEDTNSNSDLEIMPLKPGTPDKSLLDNTGTRSSKLNFFGTKSTENVKSLTFESFFKNKHVRCETRMYNIETNIKLLQSNFENISPNKNVDLLSLENIHQASSLENETFNINNSSSGTESLKSVLEQIKNCKAMSNNSVLSPKLSSSSKKSPKLDSEVHSPKPVESILCTNRLQYSNSNKKRGMHGIHSVSESSSASNCDDNYNSATCHTRNVLDAHKIHESGSQRNSIDRLKALLDDSFEINDTVLINAEEEDRSSEVTQKLTQPVTPDQTKQISKAVTPPNVAKFMPSTDLALTVSTPSPQIIVSDKVTPMPSYSSMDTPLLKKELQKFGLKQSLGRNKSIRLLQYIYDQTHPFVQAHGSQQKNDNIQTTVEAKRSLYKNHCTNGKNVSQQLKSKRVETAEPETDVESDLTSCSSESVLSSNSATDGEKESSESCSGGGGGDDDDDKDDVEVVDGNTQSTTDSSATAKKLTKISCEKINEVMAQMFLNDSEFYSQLVMYEPVPLAVFTDRLKTLGYRVKISEIRRYLDSKSIVYQLPNSKTQIQSRKRRRRRRSVCGSENDKTSSNKSSPIKKRKRIKSSENCDE